MDLAGLALIVAGAGVISLGVLRMRGPLAAIRRLDETEANLQRYETWRGKRNSIDADGPTGADEMRSQLRHRVRLWGVVVGVGAAMIAVGAFL